MTEPEYQAMLKRSSEIAALAGFDLTIDRGQVRMTPSNVIQVDFMEKRRRTDT